MQRAIFPALSLFAFFFGLVEPERARAQSLDAGVPFDAATSGIEPPPSPPAPPDAGVLADGGVLGVPIVVPGAPAAEAPIDVGGETPIDVGSGAETPVDVGAPAPHAPGKRTLGGGSADGVIDVTVRSRAKEAQKLQRSAEAVSVVDLKKAQQRTADLGEVLARTQGVTLRRSGGLGSTFRFFLNGLSDDQIRYFLDGIPLELAGFAQGIANVPVNLVERAEVYRGVVPIRFGVDALGGAVNLVTSDNLETGGDVSYQISSFHTHRVTASARYRHQPTGFFVKASGYFDDTDNDYPVDVEVADPQGRLSPAHPKPKRFHDGYRAWGASLEAGVVERKWAERLLVRGFVGAYDNEVQSNFVMTVPYGEVTYGATVGGTSLRYAQPITKNLHIDLTGQYGRRIVDFVDKASWVYDWYGRRGRQRPVPGEINGTATDQTNWQDTGYARAVLVWRLSAEHELRAASTVQSSSRWGDERLQEDPTARDPLTAERKLLTAVSGVEYQTNAVPFEGGKGGDTDFNVRTREGAVQDADAFTGFRLQNIAFAKVYNYRVHAEDPLPGGVFRRADNSFVGMGVGDGLRYTFTKYLYAKASYEYAIRLPRPDEVFGNNIQIGSNLNLDPERSQNANLGPQLDLKRSVIGNLLVDLNWFLRDTHKQILLTGNDRYWTYQNLYKARSTGLETRVAWVSPGRWVNADGSFTWQEQRNTSSQGAFGAYKGDRIPNRPYLLGSWGSNLRFAKLLHDGDALEPYYTGRYVHSFYRGWESQGIKAWKQVIPTQLSHDVGITYTVNTDHGAWSASVEAHNLTDAQLFDNFGAQKPGRWYGLKVTGQL